MKLNLVALIIVLAYLSSYAQDKALSPKIPTIKIEVIPMEGASIRAIEAQPDSSVFYASSNGYMGFIRFSNTIEQTGQIRYDTIIPHFRAVASNGKNHYALSVANPALLYQLGPNGLKLVYTEVNPDVFYDSMTFFDENNGIAMGDPINGCLSVIITHDGGTTWEKLPCSKLPVITPGEAAFAASNTNIATADKHAWLVTGGKRARVFHTPDMGQSWEVIDTPIIEGGQMTGIYSVDFQDSMNGIIFGGDWNDKARNTGNKAITRDGGKSWQLVADGKEPGYRSCVQYIPETNGKELVSVGATGISYSNDGGLSWEKLSDDGFYTIRFVNKNLAWLAGNNKIAKLIINE